MLLTDYLGTKVLDAMDDKLRQYINQDELQKLLLKCFEECRSRRIAEGKPDYFNIDRNLILNISPEGIQPNLTKKQIKGNLSRVFEKCILTDDECERESAEMEICSAYQKSAMENMLELYHIQEGILDIQEGVENLEKLNNQQHEDILKVRKELKAHENEPLNFIDELGNSRCYCYIEFKVSTDIEELCDVIREQIQESTGGEVICTLRDDMYVVIINFEEPICQFDLKELLEFVDDLFFNSGVRIYGVTSHA